MTKEIFGVIRVIVVKGLLFGIDAFDEVDEQGGSFGLAVVAGTSRWRVRMGRNSVLMRKPTVGAGHHRSA